MQGAVSVPKREDGIIVEALGYVDVAVEPAIAAVGVHVDAGVDHGVIERGVEHLLLAVGACAVDGGEFVVPLPARLLAKRIEGLARRLCVQVAQRALGADGRKGDFQSKFVGGSVVEVEISHHVASRHFGEVMVKVEPPPKALVVCFFPVMIAIAFERFAQGDGKVRVVAPRPAAGDAVAGE